MPVRVVLHYQAARHGAGIIHCTIDNRSTWRHHTGRYTARGRRQVQLLPAKVCRQLRGSFVIPMAPTVYIIDDDDSLRCALTRLLRAKGYEPRSYKSVREFLSAERTSGPGCIIL